MTFEQFVLRFDAEQGWPARRGPDPAAAWNAAVEACIDAIHEDRKYLTPTATLLEGLKTPLEGANDSEVVHG